MTLTYDGQFGRNIVAVVRTGCGITTFLENLRINKFFGNLVKCEWISGIDIDKKREAKIQSCFSNQTEVHIVKERDELDSLIETFKLRTHDIPDENDVNSLFGKNKKMDRVIVMNDVLGVADISKKFANFLTVSRKFGYHFVYVFYVIAPATQIQQKIIFQTYIFNIFPVSVPKNNLVKILQSNCNSQSKKYVLVRSLWLNRVFTHLANSHEKRCLTIDSSYENKNGPGRNRSAADNPDEQVCYFNKPNDDKYYNVFISKRIKAENFSDGIYFKIKRVREKTDKENFDTKKTLEGGASNDRLSKIFSITKSEQTGTGARKRHEDSIEHLHRRDRKSSRPNFSQDDNDVPKKKRKITAKSNYSNTKVKARNLLTNISYRRFKQKHFKQV